MKKTLNEIAAFLGAEVSGDGGVVIERISGIDEAGPGDLTFVANAKYRKKLETTAADAVLVAPGTTCAGKNLLVVSDPYAAFGRLLALFHPEEEAPAGIQPGAHIEAGADVSPEAVVYPGVHVCRGARIARRAVLYPGVFIGREAVVGEGSILYPRVTLYRRCVVGKGVVLHAGVVVGSDGFGFARPGRENVKIPQIGIVQIDDDVEIGANTTIDRGTLGKTWIQQGAKIDNLVQIAHNVVIGAYSIVVAQVGISGSTQLGQGVIVGGQSGIVGHIRIGDHTMVAAGSGVHKDIPPGQIVAGAPHLPHREWLKMEACLPKLPEMRTTLAALQRRLEALEKKIEKKEPL
ncbi:MAG: UDP-3-O-(3-hydroxymyristoyl)glucosamine N-acyltransferase [Deltaproteobacteria bacterium]|nr:UDP-3-O-(3-hydroxymyristoyl)glucosamine N-acyltransferase [Deltaproteobacteria bacterium]